MISVGRGGSRVRNGRKGMEVGFRNGDMEENELEEGEASFDSTIDPDIALSYIDEKLHHLLGDCQKEFEGGVSAENLGAKFGGYGSFLHAYQRSPSWPRPRTPPEVINQNRPRSPNNMQSEGARQSSLSASSNFPSAGLTVTSSAGPELKAPSGNDQVDQGGSVLSNNVVELSSKVEPDKATNFPDQKTLKFRIKVGVDNLSTCKNAEIYSGLGLDVSPSSSLDNSPTESEVLYHDLQDIPDESPTSILQIMTSMRSFGGLLLSPLSDDVTQLTKNGGLWEEGQAKPSNKFNSGSALLVSGSGLTNSGERKPKLLEESAVSVEPSNDINKDNQNGSGIVLKKEDIDSSACEELVSNALKLPHLSNSFYHAANSGKDIPKSVPTSRNAIKSSVKNCSMSNAVEEELLESVAQNGKIEKLNKKVRKPDSVDENLVPHQAKSDFSNKNESDVSEERKYAKSNDFLKQKIGQKVSAHNEDGSKLKIDQKVPSHNADGSKSAPGESQSFSGGKKKSKGSQNQCSLGTESRENSSLLNSSMVPKSKKVTNSDGPKKRHGKATDKYRPFFGDLDIEQYDEEIASKEMTSVQKVRDSELVEKRGISGCNIADEKFNDTRSHMKLPSRRPPQNGKWPNHDATIPMAAPLKEDWVCCDKCQIWRLLPLGTNPESLPEKWLCSMLDWLPGMNRCSVTEEETTNALRALYQTQASAVPLPLPAASGSQLDQHANSGMTMLGVSPVDARRSNEDCHSSVSQPTASGGKRKNGTKDVMTTTNQDGPIHSSNLKNNLQTCARNFSEVDHSSNEELRSQYVDQPSKSFVDKHGTEKEKRILLDINCEEGGETKFKSKDRRENDSGFPRAPKKIKTEDQRNRGDNRTSDPGGASSKAGRSSNGWSGKDSRRSSSGSKDSKGDPKRRSVSSNKFEVQMSVFRDDDQQQIDKSGNDGSMNKRKGSEHQNGDFDSVHLQSSQQHAQGSRSYSEDTHENELRKDKKARASKSEGKDSSRNKDDSVSGKKGRGMTDQKMRQDLDCTPSRRSMDAADSLKRDLGPGQPSLATTSSSSKVSGSCKSKTSLQEMKDSPVESVSSSPLRISGTDRTQVRRNIAAKEDQEAGFFASGSPRRSFEREFTGVGDQSMKMDSSFNAIHHGSLGSSVLDFQGKDLDHGSVIGKAECASLTEFVSQCGSRSKSNAPDQGKQISSQTETLVQIQPVGKRNDHQSPSNGLHMKKSGKGSTSKSSEKISGSIAGLECGNETAREENMKAARNKFQEKTGSSSDRTEKHSVSKRGSDGKLVENQPQISGRDGTVVEPDVITSRDMKQNVPQDSDNDRSSRKLVSDRTGIDIPGRGKSHSLPPTVRGQTDAMTRLQPIAESQKEHGECKEHDAVSKASKQCKKAEKQNGNQHMNLRHPTPPLQKSRDIEAPSPVRKDSSSQAVTNAVKEAKDLKHLADRRKNSGLPDSTGYYFQAALKFLHGASLLESSNSENTKNNEMIQSMQMYSSTAKLCEFCAHEYERSKDMAAAALAYKCMEVAYMRVVYTSHNSASRDRNELLGVLQITPTGESPSSSASDVDNLNNPAMVDKGAQSKSAGSPQIAGNHVLAARNRSSFMRLINYAQDVNNAMEAARKSRNAFAAANPRDGAQHKEGISFVKKVLDFNFQDVDGLLRLVRVAMEAI